MTSLKPLTSSLLHLWLSLITFMVVLLHLWLVDLFVAESYYIYGQFLLHLWLVLHLRFLLHLWVINTIQYKSGIRINRQDRTKSSQIELYLYKYWE